MALGDAWRAIRAGEADLAFAGGTDGLAGDLDAFAMMGFDRLKTLSTRNDEPERASRPFDRNRDGFVLGEGAAVLVLERESHARARGARAYAAVTGYASNCDALSMLQPDESGERIVALARAALARAGRSETEVAHVSAHATSTVANDRTEARAFRALFGSRTDEIPVTGLKSMTGHAIGGSGAMETAALALSIREGILTPTINYELPDPECDLRVVANRPLLARPALALKLSYGFGGHNACLVLERP
jgi:3-oxoacyl-[acyl-carrier-protein] synthase II